jgi:NhaP-type Na+/H+ or K+/H+ antiporter
MVISGIIRLSGGYEISPSGHNIMDEQNYFDPTLLGLSSSVFYFIMLPPILFNSGYHLKRHLMYSNFTPIWALSIVGTLLSVLFTLFTLLLIYNSFPNFLNVKSMTIMEMLAFASLISSTDPVSTLSIYKKRRIDNNLFYIVFGESVFNDAVALTLFSLSSKAIDVKITVQDILFFIMRFLLLILGSSTVGYVFGIGSAYIFKLFRDKKNQGLFAATSAFFLIFIPFYISEIIGLSGIVTTLFAGISSRRYLNKNLSIQSVKKISFLLEFLSQLFETACFSLLGLSVFSTVTEYVNFAFIALTLLAILVARLNVYPILAIVRF